MVVLSTGPAAGALHATASSLSTPDRSNGVSAPDRRELELRLGELQRQARAAGIPIVVVFEGWSAAGKGTHIGELVLPLDPRGFTVWPISAPSEEELLHPYFWRFWNKLPARGHIAIFDHSWYQRVLIDRVERRVPAAVWERTYDDIVSFERQLADDGAVLVKFWLDIGKREQKKRFRQIRKDPAQAWRVTDDDRRQHRRYKAHRRAVAKMIEATGTAAAPWTAIDSSRRRAARELVFTTMIDAIRRALAERAAPRDTRSPVPAGAATGTVPTPPAVEGFAEAVVVPRAGDMLLSKLDLTARVERAAYEIELPKLQARLRELEYAMYTRRVPAIVAYEGCDAAGKGGSIKRLTQRLDPRGYAVIPIAAPTPEEQAHHYLWRFWRRLPKAGHIAIFDRTWYGRVLVERVEGFCRPDEWQRAFDEINAFERQLTDAGTVLVKFWLQIDREEQLRRFREREQTPWKQWKITEEDWRNREKWPAYEQAICEMIERTSTPAAPWTMVESVDKLHARLKALRTVIGAIEAAL